MSELKIFVSESIREFRRIKKLSDDAVVQLSEAQFFEIPGEGDNSVAIVYKHMSGNLLSRWTDFLTSDGEKAWRDRDNEFEILDTDSRARLLAQWEKGWGALFTTLSDLEESGLTKTVTIRGESLSVLQAITRQLTHYAYHVGQIVYVAKHFAGANWKSLSIPPGQSKAFNKAPKKYIEKDPQ